MFAVDCKRPVVNSATRQAVSEQFNIELDDFARLKWVSTVCDNVWTEVAVWTKLAGNVGVARIIGNLQVDMEVLHVQ
jgi:hypothetical protein